MMYFVSQSLHVASTSSSSQQQQHYAQ